MSCPVLLYIVVKVFTKMTVLLVLIGPFQVIVQTILATSHSTVLAVMV